MKPPLKNNQFSPKEMPADYYERWGILNLLQWLWHHRKISVVRDLMGQCPQFFQALDVGCNGGTQTAKLAASFPAAKFRGVDLSAEAIKYGRRKYPQLELIRADALRLPFANRSFDLIYSLETLEHVVSPKKALEEMKRCLKKNGSIIVELDSGSWLFRFIWFFWVRSFGRVWQGTHLWQLDTKNLERLFARNQLMIVSKRFFNLGMGVVYRLRIA